MRRFAPTLVTLAALCPAVAFGPPSSVADAPPAVAPGAAPLRAECRTPRALRLRRFEDGSARLHCGRRLLVRVSVPG